jgi:hypothetical protein
MPAPCETTRSIWTNTDRVSWPSFQDHVERPSRRTRGLALHDSLRRLVANTCLSDNDGSLNVGWLDSAFPFATGRSDDTFPEKLARICARQQRVNQTRGFHECNLCELLAASAIHLLKTSCRELFLGSAERCIGASPLFCHTGSDYSLRRRPFLSATRGIRSSCSDNR